jgi:hypothetical protein
MSSLKKEKCSTVQYMKNPEKKIFGGGLITANS